LFFFFSIVGSGIGVVDVEGGKTGDASFAEDEEEGIDRGCRDFAIGVGRGGLGFEVEGIGGEEFREES
jgi:hypothetical protein